jgi:hypothetical protein
MYQMILYREKNFPTMSVLAIGLRLLRMRGAQCISRAVLALHGGPDERVYEPNEAK